MRAAVSLTFDDGLPVQLEHAVPELDARGIRATFFLIEKSPYSAFDREAWQQVAATGHEIGAHSVNHAKLADLSEEDSRFEVRESKQFLEAQLGVTVDSYCYPYTDVNAVAEDEVRKHYRQARGGRVAREDKFIIPGDGADIFNLPCFHAGARSVNDVSGWVREAIDRGGWFILMFHGIGPDPSQWDNIERPDFRTMLDGLLDSGIDILTLRDGAERVRNSR